MLDNLKIATKINHSSVEKVLVQKLKNLSSQEEYANLLFQFYGFYFELEKKVHSIIDKTLLSDMSKRVHVANLHTDLVNLNHSVAITSVNNYPETIRSVSEALGVLYVIEGSTLGGQFIAGMLKKQLPTLDDSQINYFLSYGENTMEMWKQFKNSIQETKVEFDEKSTLNAAQNTFKALENWLLLN
ncbi:heme oxygenase [Flavobacterium sp. 28A]|uniref:biliverdin-producing heme oxygenase n=1 Tax=Flavobacterium sp. 28A TaxID=2735895 RepID=UPI00156FDC54|nr:biliverdin-producing heme oxygenase [Flavobacterium sp. 28A]NRT14865.1 heme oxygenase [Flavobacterium sp. 28A]